MGPIIGRAIASGVSALAKNLAKKGAKDIAEEEVKRKGANVVTIAAENAKRTGRNMADELISAEKNLQTKRDLATAQANPARQAAEQAAETSYETGVKTTKYPYVKPTPENMRKGGAVKAASASKRADGIAQRGKTKGRMC